MPKGAISDPRLLTGLEYWQAKAGAGGIMRRADLDPVEIPQLLPHAMLVEVLACGRYRYRLIGTEIARAQGINATGCYVDEVVKGPEYKDHIVRTYDTCV